MTKEKREYPDRPYVGVGVIVLRDQEVLLVKRNKEPNKGQWSIPGGKQMIGETVAEGVGSTAAAFEYQADVATQLVEFIDPRRSNHQWNFMNLLRQRRVLDEFNQFVAENNISRSVGKVSSYLEF